MRMAGWVVSGIWLGLMAGLCAPKGWGACIAIIVYGLALAFAMLESALRKIRFESSSTKENK